jgi:hypothetical protein
MKFRNMIGEESAVAFWIWGGSACSGNCAEMRETASRTSLAASSRSRSSLNEILIREAPSRDEEFTRSIPSIPATWRSMSSVMRSSITSAEAPR